MSPEVIDRTIEAIRQWLVAGSSAPRTNAEVAAFNARVACAVLQQALHPSPGVGVRAKLSDLKGLEEWPLMMDPSAMAEGALRAKLTDTAAAQITADIERDEHWQNVTTTMSTRPEQKEKSGTITVPKKPTGSKREAAPRLWKAYNEARQEGEWASLSAITSTLATTGHYLRDRVLPSGGWGGVDHFIVRVAEGANGELPLSRLTWDKGNPNAVARLNTVLTFLEAKNVTEDLVKKLVGDVTSGTDAPGGGQRYRQLAYLTILHDLPVSLVVTLPSKTESATSDVHHARGRLLQELLKAAMGAGAAVRERIVGKVAFDEGLRAVAGQAPITALSDASAWAAAWGGYAVYVHLAFPDAEAKARSIESMVGLPRVDRDKAHGGVDKSQLQRFVDAMKANVQRTSHAWHPTVTEKLANAGLSLPTFPNLILEGVPGTGKTFFCDEIRKSQPEPSQAGEIQTFRRFRGTGEGRFAITLHPATSYEDFVEGLRPATSPGDGSKAHKNGGEPPAVAQVRWAKVEGETCRIECGTEVEKPNPTHFWHPPDPAGGTSGFSVQDGFFLRACREALFHPEFDFIVLLDEINRCNVPKVLGDLITTLEGSKRARWVPDPSAGPLKGYWNLEKCQTVSLPYSGRTFFVPDNVYVIATMNTTDRSVAPLDAALRRRFAFKRMWPKGFSETTEVPARDAEVRAADCAIVEFVALEPDVRRAFGVSTTDATVPTEARDKLGPSVQAWHALNRALLSDLGEDAMLGHSYLFSLKNDLEDADRLHRWRGGRFDAAAIVRDHWNHYILPQLADILESNNAIDLLTDKKPTRMLPGTLAAIKKLDGFGALIAQPEGVGMMRRAKLVLGA